MSYPLVRDLAAEGIPVRWICGVLGHLRQAYDELHEAIVFWTEHTYNRRRRQRALGKLTPVQYELAFTAQHAAVAA